MSTPTEPTQGHDPAFGARQVNDAELGRPTWIESGAGFPIGAIIGADGVADRDIVTDGHNDHTGTDDPIASVGQLHFSGDHGRLVVAFVEFLAGVALDQSERDWLVDAMAREFVADADLAVAELAKIERAVVAIPRLEPVQRAGSRFTALTGLYRIEPLREELGVSETPMMSLVKAHNPALLIHKTGVIVVADALDARHNINELVLRLAGHDPGAQPYLRAELTEQYRSAPITMKAELAGSQVRLVSLRRWLATLPQDELDRLRARLAEVIHTATDLDLITLQLSFRSMLESNLADLAH